MTMTPEQVQEFLDDKMEEITSAIEAQLASGQELTAEDFRNSINGIEG